MNQKNKKIIPFVLLAILVIVAALFVIGSLFMRIKNTSANYLKEKEEIAILRSKERKLEGEDLLQVLSTKKELEKLFTNPERPISEIVFLENRAANNNLDHAVSVGEKKTKNGWPYLEFEVDLTGNLDSGLSFFKDLETEKRALFIDELEIDFNQDNFKEDNEKVNLSAKLGIYYLPED